MIQADVVCMATAPPARTCGFDTQGLHQIRARRGIKENPNHPGTLPDLPVQPFPISGVLDIPIKLTRQALEGSASHRPLLMPVATISETALSGAKRPDFTPIVDHP